MELFHIIDEGVVHLRSRGVYRQAKVYRRGTEVFAAHGGGYIKLRHGTGTSKPDVSWDALEAPGVGLGNGGCPFFSGDRTARAA